MRARTRSFVSKSSGQTPERSGREVKKISIAAACLCTQAALFAQEPAAPPPNDIESLRQQVQALTETVKALQEQVKDQQDALVKMNAVPSPLPANENRAATAESTASPPPLFPTSDESVVAAAPQPSAPPIATSQFPTTDASVTTSTATISSSGAGASLTAPITIGGGGKTYMNLSFDGQFALAYSSDRDLAHLETGDHDPQQRGFNARNIELALDGAHRLGNELRQVYTTHRRLLHDPVVAGVLGQVEGAAGDVGRRQFAILVPGKAGDGRVIAFLGEVHAEPIGQNVSARGVFFYLDRPLAEGMRIEVTMTFPPHVTLTEPVRVRFTARVVRLETSPDYSGIGVAAMIEEYEFLRSSAAEFRSGTR